MASYNRVILMGNLTRDPEVRSLPSGTVVADLGLAVSREFRGQDGQNREETCFVNCTVFGKQAETCGQYLKKGRQVLIEGRLHYEQWEKDGQKRSTLKVVAERVQFLGGGRGEGSAAGGSEAGGSRYAGRREPAAAEPPAAPEVDAPSGGGGDDDNLPF